MTMQQFIRRLIMEMGVSQRQFAEAVGVDEKSLSRYLRKTGRRQSISERLTDILFKDCMAELLCRAARGAIGYES